MEQDNNLKTENSKPKKSGLCFLISLIGFFVFIGIIISIYFFQDFKEKPFPELTEPKTTIFNWEYKAQEYTLEQTFYKSVDEYYSAKPKGIYEGKQEKNYNSYVEQIEEDKSIENLAEELIELGQELNLNNDEIIDFVLSFVQAIPYDNDNIEELVFSPRYPYEVLYDNAGICSGKSFLAYSLFRELNYGVSLFDYEKVHGSDSGHLSVGVQCLTKYSNYDSGYCYAEATTLGYKIGNISQLDPSGQAIDREFDFYNEQEEIPSGNELGEVEIFIKIHGNEYKKIIENIETENRIDILENEMEELKPEVDANQIEIEELNTELKDIQYKMEQYDSEGDIQNYNKLVPIYNNLVNEVNVLIKETEWLINKYNIKVREYNNLIEDY